MHLDFSHKDIKRMRFCAVPQQHTTHYTLHTTHYTLHNNTTRTTTPHNKNKKGEHLESARPPANIESSHSKGKVVRGYRYRVSKWWKVVSHIFFFLFFFFHLFFFFFLFFPNHFVYVIVVVVVLGCG